MTEGLQGITQADLVWAFNQWKLNYNDTPESFDHNAVWSEDGTYGDQCVAYIKQLLK